MKNVAPSYIAGLVAVVMGLQSFFGFDFVAEQWTSFFLVGSGIVVAIRQLITGRANIFGGRPTNFQK